MIKKIIKKLTPNPIVKIYKNYKESHLSSTLFNGDDEMFKRILKQHSTTYGEYGSGQSTRWVLEHTDNKIISVETSMTWAKKVSNLNCQHAQRLNIRFIDLGGLGDWGEPIGYSKRDSFQHYTDFLWIQNEKPKIVLIDGRFRVCCFLTSLKYADEGTIIIFDDYKDRPYYHIVEEYVDRIEECGRQCLFKVPHKSKLDVEKLNKDISNFRHVMD